MSKSPHGGPRLHRAPESGAQRDAVGTWTAGHLATVMLALSAGALLTAGPAGPRFYPDDPIHADDDRAFDARGVAPSHVRRLEDLVNHTLGSKGDRRDVAAMNVNTLGELPDSSWFTNRIGRGSMTLDEIVRGPDRFVALAIDGWPIVEGKGEGVQPGIRVRDPEGHLYQVKFDPIHRPELSTSAEIISTAIFHALGYNVAETYLVEFDPSKSVIAEDARITDGGGRSRRLVHKDIEDTLAAAARLPNGRYRGIASRFIDGQPLGPFKYWSTRPDDPNDVVPHEHRRELRGMRVFAAWMNHDEANSTNTYDALVEANGRAWVKHYLLDFGSTLGSDTMRAQRGRSGNEYLLEWGPGFATAATLGFYLRPWLRVHYRDEPRSIGHFEGEFFDPLAWKPVYPNPAFDNMRPDDAFWAASLVARFDDPTVRAIVGKARYSDPEATEYIVQTLLRRRQKVLAAWLNAVAPIAHVRLAGDGILTFENVAVSAGAAASGAEYQFTWFNFDNATGARVPIGGASGWRGDRSTKAPAGLMGDYAGVVVAARHPDHPAWASRPATIYFRNVVQGWETVGIER